LLMHIITIEYYLVLGCVPKASRQEGVKRTCLLK
jgi:hypothetical protein